ncbi:MAG: TmcC family electron transfer complex membrane anchor subunit [Nitrospirota bacterium]
MYDFLTGMEFYRFLKGPMVWFAFIIFTGGSAYRVISLVYRSRNAKVIYTYMDLKYSLRSILHWIIPFASTNMRNHPWMTIITFLFHGCLIFTPVFLLAHNMLIQESWNIAWWTLPERTADAMTFIVIMCVVFFAIRRLVSPEVRFVTSASDFVILSIAAAPFVTGFLAFHHLMIDYRLALNIHILAGEIMLIAIPFTRLSHMLFFWLIRAYTGSDFGAVRHSKDY